MKIERKKVEPEFVPVHIVLENRDDVARMAWLIDSIFCKSLPSDFEELKEKLVEITYEDRKN